MDLIWPFVDDCFSWSSMQFQGHAGQTRSLGQPQLSNPSDLPCWYFQCSGISWFYLIRHPGTFISQVLFQILFPLPCSPRQCRPLHQPGLHQHEHWVLVRLLICVRRGFLRQPSVGQFQRQHPSRQTAGVIGISEFLTCYPSVLCFCNKDLHWHLW